MTAVQAALLLLCGAYGVLGITVWHQKPKSAVHALTLAHLVCLTAWALSLFFAAQAEDLARATQWVRVGIFGPTTVFVSFFLLLVVLDPSRKNRTIPWVMLTPVLLGGVLLIGAFHPDVLRAARPTPGRLVFTYGAMYPLEMLGTGILCLVTLVQGVRIGSRLVGKDRARAEIMLLSMLISSVLASIPNLFLPLTGASEHYLLGPFSFVVAAVGLAYAVMKHHPFDLEVAIGRVVHTRRSLVHARVKEILASPEGYLSLATLSQSLQEAFDSTELNIALLDRSAAVTKLFGNQNLPVPSQALIYFRNGRVLTPVELPPDLSGEMRKKGLAAVIRLGDPSAPRAVVNLGQGFERILFSSQDLALLRELSLRLDLIIRIAGEYMQAVDHLSARRPGREAEGEREEFPGLRSTQGRQVLVLDPGGNVHPLIADPQGVGLIVRWARTSEEVASQVVETDWDLLVLVPGDVPNETTVILRRVRELRPDLPVLILDGVENAPSPPEWYATPQVIGIQKARSRDPKHAYVSVSSAIAASRYVRGELDPLLLDASPQARKKLFPLLLRSLSEAKDYSSLVRLFQKRLLEFTLRRSRTQAEAARKLGLSTANMSLKLKFLGLRSRAPGG